jgi:hypothetical protein
MHTYILIQHTHACTQFIEHIAHLTAKDYAKVPADLVKLGFVPAGKEDDILKTDAVSHSHIQAKSRAKPVQHM